MAGTYRERALSQNQAYVEDLMCRVHRIYGLLNSAYVEMRALNRAIGNYPPDDPAPVILFPKLPDAA